MTIHFHPKHFIENELSLYEYMICLMYETDDCWTTQEIGEILKLNRHTIGNIRTGLIKKNYLKHRDDRISSRSFILTDKLYPPCIQKKT